MSEKRRGEAPFGKTGRVEVLGKPMGYFEYGNPNGQPIITLGMGAPDTALDRAFTGHMSYSKGFQEMQDRTYLAWGLVTKVHSMQGKYHVFSPELPGWGETPPLKDPTAESMAEALGDFMHAVNVDKAIVLGQSHSGLMAIKLAAKHPEKISMLVLQAPPTRWDDLTAEAKDFVKLMWSPLGEALMKSDKASKLLKSALKVDPQTHFPLWRELIKDVTPDMEKVQCPVVVIGGVEDTRIKIGNMSEASTRFHPEVTDSTEKYPQNVVFLPIAYQGHEIINGFPEAVAVWTDYVASRILK